MITRITSLLLQENSKALTTSLWGTLWDANPKFTNLMRIRDQFRDSNSGILGRMKDNVLISLGGNV